MSSNEANHYSTKQKGKKGNEHRDSKERYYVPVVRDYVGEMAAKNKYWVQENDFNHSLSNLSGPSSNTSRNSQSAHGSNRSRNTSSGSLRSNQHSGIDNASDAGSSISYQNSFHSTSLLQHHFSADQVSSSRSRSRSRRPIKSSMLRALSTDGYVESTDKIDILEEQVKGLQLAMQQTTKDKRRIREEKEKHQHEVVAYQLKIQALEMENKKLLQNHIRNQQLEQWKEESEEYDDDSYSSAEHEFGGELTAAEYERRIRDYKQQIEDLEASLENLQVEMAEDSERCEEELNKMDQLVHSIQTECTAEMERMKQTYEKEHIKVLEEEIKKLKKDLMGSDQLLEEERGKNKELELNFLKFKANDVSTDDMCDVLVNGDDVEFMKSKSEMNNEFTAIKAYLEQTSKELQLAEEDIKQLKKEKEQLVQELETEQNENIVRLEMIDQITLQMQESEKECEEKKKKFELRISELEKEVELLATFKNNSTKTTTFASSSFKSNSPGNSRQSSLRSSRAALRKQNSIERRQKVIENSMQEMDDMIIAMRERARQRKKPVFKNRNATNT